MTQDTKIRAYVLEDIPVLVEMCIRHLPTLPNYKGITIDPERVRFMLEHNMNNDASFMLRVLIDPHDNIVGCIAGYCVMLLFSRDLHCNDIIMFIEEQWRTQVNARKLMGVYIAWAKARKATIIGASQTSGYRSELMTRFITSFGFEEIGKLYHLRGDKS